ncbi:MAG TPA: 50S ribosomal protein L6 [Planctomycetota bacterium]|jgi:large subunit ribosomal protein L6|nr:50S ribosomal protein L6 [Planctomycetota bacterium]
MSRIGRQHIQIPAGVTVECKADHKVFVKGPKGQLEIEVRPEIDVEVDKTTVKVLAKTAAEDRFVRAWHGMTRALIQNMVVGVTKGYEKKLEIQGVGWNAAAQGNKVVLNIGFNKPVTVPMPVGVQVGTPSPTNIVIFGADKQKVGDVAASIRKRRPPEPYKGKGIRYDGEVVQRKAGKSFGATAS